MKAYRIKNSETLFETAETRKLKRLTWVAIPNKHDGKGYRRLLRLQDGPLLYAAWIGMLTVASKCPTRWLLADNDGPLTAQDLADKTDIPVTAYETAFKVLMSKDIGWLDECEIDSNLLESPGTPADPPAIPVLKGREGNGMGEKGKTEGAPDEPAPTATPVRAFQQSDREFLDSLKRDPTYAHLDIDFEFGKMQRWCTQNKKLASQKRFINWVNRVERPMGKSPPLGAATGQPVVNANKLDSMLNRNEPTKRTA